MFGILHLRYAKTICVGVIVGVSIGGVALASTQQGDTPTNSPPRTPEEFVAPLIGQAEITLITTNEAGKLSLARAADGQVCTVVEQGQDEMWANCGRDSDLSEVPIVGFSARTLGVDPNYAVGLVADDVVAVEIGDQEVNLIEGTFLVETRSDVWTATLIKADGTSVVVDRTPVFGTEGEFTEVKDG